MKINKYKNIEVIKILSLAFFIFILFKVPNAYAFFDDRTEVKGTKFKAGEWIPKITSSVFSLGDINKENVYAEAPCVKIFSDMDNVKIYYLLKNEEEHKRGEMVEGACIYPPQGNSELIVWAVNNKNKKWISKKIDKDFKVEYKNEKGDVIINEIMWMGSFKDSADEWIELRNTTKREIDLSNWEIEYSTKENINKIKIPQGYKIKTNGYFLIMAKKYNEAAIIEDKDPDKKNDYVYFDNFILKDGGGKMALIDSRKNVIDLIGKESNWLGGWLGKFLHMSMERNEKWGDGTKSASWHTCVSEKCNNKEYWKEEGLNFGTPGKRNSVPGDDVKLDSDKFEEKMLEKIFSESSLLKNIWNDNFKKHNHKHKPKEDKDNDAAKPETEDAPSVMEDVAGIDQEKNVVETINPPAVSEDTPTEVENEDVDAEPEVAAD